MTRYLNIREDVIKGLPKMAAMTVVAHGENPPPPTVPGCKILGFKSRNNRTYTREALIKAAHKYEGVKVNLDHNTGTDPRKFSERFGRMVNVRMQGDGLYGDLQYNPAHPLAEAFRWWIKHDPTAIGLSHNATAEVQNTATGGELVTEIRDVDSVDLVADPATTQGLFESYKMKHVAEESPTSGETDGYRAYHAGVKVNPYKSIADKSNKHPRMGDTTKQLNWQNGWEKAHHEMTTRPTHGGNKPYYGRTNEADDESEQMEKVLLGNEQDERITEMQDDELPGMAPPPMINSDMGQEPVPEADEEGEENFATHLGNAIMAIINDAGLSSADKRKKVLGALKLMDDDQVAEGEPEPDGDEMAPPLPAPEPIDENEDIEPVDEADGDDEAAQMEQDLLGDEEAGDGKAPPFKKKAEESINPKVQALMNELDAYRVKESLGLKKTKLLRKCKEAKIPTEAVTSIFVAQLMRLKESAWPQLIADRKAIAKRSTVKPISTSVAVVSESYDTFVTELLNK